MNAEKIARINALAKKNREEGLSEQELIERDALRREYIDSVKGSLGAHLDNTYVQQPDGSKEKLRKKGDD